DGGTRTAAITGAYIALADAVSFLRGRGAGNSLKGEPLLGSVAAVSVGIVDGVPMLDLPYEEDVHAQTDMNVVMTGDGRFIEVQGTAEAEPFDRNALDELLGLAAGGCAELARMQVAALAEPSVGRRCCWPAATGRSSTSCGASLPHWFPRSRCSGSTTCRPTTSRR